MEGMSSTSDGNALANVGNRSRLNRVDRLVNLLVLAAGRFSARSNQRCTIPVDLSTKELRRPPFLLSFTWPASEFDFLERLDCISVIPRSSDVSNPLGYCWYVRIVV